MNCIFSVSWAILNDDYMFLFCICFYNVKFVSICPIALEIQGYHLDKEERDKKKRKKVNAEGPVVELDQNCPFFFADLSTLYSRELTYIKIYKPSVF